MPPSSTETWTSFVADLKQQPGGNIIKYGNGPLDVTLMKHGLVDEFHLLLTPVAVGRGQHLFDDIDTAQSLNLVDVTRFNNGVVIRAAATSPRSRVVTTEIARGARHKDKAED
jgi:dihydrofolate reductase